jgi:hypothetical protein
MTPVDLTNVRAAIQAATLAKQFVLAQEIAAQHGLTDICLSCATAESTGTIEDAAGTYVLLLCDACSPAFPLEFAPALRKRLLRRRR